MAGRPRAPETLHATSSLLFQGHEGLEPGSVDSSLSFHRFGDGFATPYPQFHS
jgi:hypothetical protein